MKLGDRKRCLCNTLSHTSIIHFCPFQKINEEEMILKKILFLHMQMYPSSPLGKSDVTVEPAGPFLLQLRMRMLKRGYQSWLDVKTANNRKARTRARLSREIHTRAYACQHIPPRPVSRKSRRHLSPESHS